MFQSFFNGHFYVTIGGYFLETSYGSFFLVSFLLALFISGVDNNLTTARWYR